MKEKLDLEEINGIYNELNYLKIVDHSDIKLAKDSFSTIFADVKSFISDNLDGARKVEILNDCNAIGRSSSIMFLGISDRELIERKKKSLASDIITLETIIRAIIKYLERQIRNKELETTTIPTPQIPLPLNSLAGNGHVGNALGSKIDTMIVNYNYGNQVQYTKEIREELDKIDIPAEIKSALKEELDNIDQAKQQGKSILPNIQNFINKATTVITTIAPLLPMLTSLGN